MIPNLDGHGLLPPGVFECTLPEIEARYCWNEQRRMLWSDLQRFLSQEWRPLALDCPLLVDGSFVRGKPIPDDIDVVADLSSLDLTAALTLAIAWQQRRGEFKALYNVDAWTRHSDFPIDLGAFFQYIGDKAAAELRLPMKHPKGILRIRP